MREAKPYRTKRRAALRAAGSMGGPTRTALSTIALVLLGLGLSRSFGWSSTVDAVIAALVLLFMAPLISRWWKTWRTFERPNYFLAYVATYSTTINDLSLSFYEPLYLHGVRCEVARSDAPIVHSAELTVKGWYGQPGYPKFSYPTDFSDSPQPDELCVATWFVRDAEDGEWLFAAKDEFHFGEFRDADGNLPTSYRVLHVEPRRAVLR